MQKTPALLIIASSLFLAGSIHAAEADKTMSGAYLSTDLGYTKYSIEGFAETFPPIYLRRSRTHFDIDDNGMLVRLSTGYGHYWRSTFFTAAEFGYQKLIGANRYKITNLSNQHEVDIDYSSRFDASLLTGRSTSESGLVYLRIGYGVTNVYITPHDIGGTGGAFHDLSGPLFGIGYSRVLNDRFSLRIEATRLSIRDTYNNNKNDGEIYDVKIKDAHLQMGVIFHF